MPLKVYDTEDADLDNTLDVFKDGLDPQPYFWHLFPHNDKPKGRQAAIQQLLDEKHGAHARFIKAVDTATGEAAGHAIWLVFKDEQLTDDFFELHGDFWDTLEEKEQAQYVVREFSQFRKNAIKDANGNLLVLDVLSVAQKYQRQGVGRLLVGWGTALADELGYGAIVESTKEARRLYESQGFITKYWVQITWPQKWAHLDEVVFYWLTRPPRAQIAGP